MTGTRAQAQKAFNVAIGDYQLGTRTFHAVAGDPSVPGAVAPLIAAVAGLNNLAVPTPAFSPFPFTPNSIATAYNGTLTAAGKTNSTGLPPGLDGKGQTIGLIEFDGFNYSDVSNWLSFAGLPSGLIKQVSATAINGGTGPSGCTQYQNGCGTTEVLLDIEAALGIAQGANIVVFDAPSGTDLADAINQAGNYLTYGSGGTLSMSWNVCEDDISPSDESSIDSVLSDFTAWGITLFVATGDNGSTCKNGSGGVYPGVIAFPADAPHAVAVGGTTPNVNSNNTYNTESWWLNSGGFGVSQFSSDPQPGYQSPFYSAAGRSVPDVSMDASPGIIVCQATTSDSPDCGDTGTPGLFNVIGGTSLATPLWAATWALTQQATVNAGGYQWSAANGYFCTIPKAFHRASTMTGTGNNFAHVGLGSPDMTTLVAVANPPRIDSYSPYDGPAGGGTKITIIGAGFIGVKKVTFGGVDATKITVYSDTKLTVETPPAPSEEITLELETPGGTATAAGLYTYNPQITGVSPNKGPLEGGTSVTRDRPRAVQKREVHFWRHCGGHQRELPQFDEVHHGKSGARARAGGHTSPDALGLWLQSADQRRPLHLRGSGNHRLLPGGRAYRRRLDHLDHRDKPQDRDDGRFRRWRGCDRRHLLHSIELRIDFADACGRRGAPHGHSGRHHQLAVHGCLHVRGLSDHHEHFAEQYSEKFKHRVLAGNADHHGNGLQHNGGGDRV